MRQRLQTLNPLLVDIIDESPRHAGHEGAKNGGHYKLAITSPAFSGKSTLTRHRMIYDALGDLMRTEVHALVINAISPDADSC